MSGKTLRSPRNVAGTDYVAGLALTIYLIGYGGTLIGLSIAKMPAPRYDEFGHPLPNGSGEGMGYVMVGVLLAFLFHLIVFTAFRWRLCRWPLRAVVPLQLVAVALSLAALKVLDPPLAVSAAPAFVTAAVYGVAALVVRAQSSPSHLE